MSSASAALSSTWRIRICSFTLGLDQPVANGETNEVCEVAYFELRHDAAAVGVDGAGFHADGGGDLLARAALDDELQHLAFARAEAIERSRFRVLFHRALMNRHPGGRRPCAR